MIPRPSISFVASLVGQFTDNAQKMLDEGACKEFKEMNGSYVNYHNLLD